MVSFYNFKSISTTALGSKLDATDRCVGLEPEVVEVETAPRARKLLFPPRCATTLFGSSPPTTLILNSPSSKSLVKEGGTLLPLLLVLLLQIYYK